MVSTVNQLHVSPIGVIIAIVILYIIAGMFMDVFTAVVLTVPVLCPLVTSLGYDGIWFGVIVVKMIELGLVTPPVGMNVFVLSASTGISVGTIYRGVIPFIVADFAEVAILIAFPVLSLFLPNMM
jgi:C4-dicarboxylate transporter DctM subunit